MRGYGLWTAFQYATNPALPLNTLSKPATGYGSFLKLGELPVDLVKLEVGHLQVWVN